MAGFKIVTDSTADLPKDYIEQNQLGVMVLPYIVEGVSYGIDKEMDVKDFYNKMRGGMMPTTSQVNPESAREYLEGYLEESREILVMSFSSGLSGTVNNAVLVAGQLEEKYPGRRVVVIDSLCASIGEGLLVYYAAKKRLEGLSLEALAAWVMEYRTRVAHWFTVDDLNHLKRGGRISAVEAIVGTALNIKPILSVDGEGKLTVMAKVRGSRKALEYVLSRLSAEGKDLEGQTAIVAHADNPADAETLADLVRQTGLVKDVLISKIGPIIGTHTGAGMTALVFLK